MAHDYTIQRATLRNTLAPLGGARGLLTGAVMALGLDAVPEPVERILGALEDDTSPSVCVSLSVGGESWRITLA